MVSMSGANARHKMLDVEEQKSTRIIRRKKICY